MHKQRQGPSMRIEFRLQLYLLLLLALLASLD
jgi:hypothetical protein